MCNCNSNIRANFIQEGFGQPSRRVQPETISVENAMYSMYPLPYQQPVFETYVPIPFMEKVLTRTDLGLGYQAPPPNVTSPVSPAFPIKPNPVIVKPNAPVVVAIKEPQVIAAKPIISQKPAPELPVINTISFDKNKGVVLNTIVPQTSEPEKAVVDNFDESEEKKPIWLWIGVGLLAIVLIFWSLKSM